MSDAEIKSSLPLQVLLYFHKPFSVAFFVVNVLLLFYKGSKFPYPPARFAVETLFVLFYLPIEWGRIFVASMGNKTERIPPTIIAMLVCIVTIVINVYMFQLQVYVLRLDQIINVISIVMLSLEFLLGLFAAGTFWRFGRY